MMVSPVTKGLLARARRGGALLPPSKDQLEVRFRLQNFIALYLILISSFWLLSIQQ